MPPTTRSRLLLAVAIAAAVSVTICSRSPDPLPASAPRSAADPQPTRTIATHTSAAPEAEDTGTDEPREEPDAGPQRSPDVLRCPLPSSFSSATVAGLVFAPQEDGHEPMALGLSVEDGAVSVMPEALSAGEAWLTVPGLGVIFPEVSDSGCALVDPIPVASDVTETRCPLSLPADFEVSFSTLPGADRAAIAAYRAGGPRPVLYDTFGTVDGDTLIIEGAPSGTGSVWLTANASTIELPVAWDAGRCQPPVEAPAPATVSGAVGPLLDATSAYVEVCGQAANVYAGEKGRYELLVWPGHCEATASRRDGVLTAYGEIVSFEARSGEAVTIDLSLPPEKVGGMGFQLAEHPDGIVLEQIHPGNPAADAGLVAGDIIVEIDGEPAEELSTEGFVRLGVGPIGSEVTIRVRHSDGEEEEVTLVRDELVLPD